MNQSLKKEKGISSRLKTFYNLYQRHPKMLLSFFIVVVVTGVACLNAFLLFFSLRLKSKGLSRTALETDVFILPAPARIAPPQAKGKALAWPRLKNSALLVGIAAVLVGAATFFLRAYHITQAYNIFIDEYTYLQLSHSVASSLRLQLYGQPFFLHPPAFFFLEAAVLRLFSIGGDTIQQIYSLRLFNAGIACFSGGLIFLICYRAMGWFAGLIAAILFAINSFIIRIDSLNLLEASAIGWIIAGYWVIISAMRAERLAWFPLGIPKTWARFVPQGFFQKGIFVPKTLATQSPSALTLFQSILAGFFFGLALLTKETTAFLTLIPLALCFVLNWSIQRRRTIAIGVVAVLTYSVYPLVVYLNGDWSSFVYQKFRGILRFIGMIQITGLNRASGPSLTGTILNRLDLYATTYALIGLGVAATFILLTSRGSITRLIGLWSASAYAMLAYLIFLGTLEEQFFLYLVVPSLVACAVVAALLLKSLSGRSVFRSAYVSLIVLVLLFTSWDAYQWVHVHTIPDNGYEQVMAYLRKNVPGGVRVASTSEIGQYILGGYLSGPFGLWHSTSSLIYYAPQYLLVTPQTVEWNYGASGRELLAWVEQHGRVTYAFIGRGDEIILYHLDIPKSTQPHKP